METLTLKLDDEVRIGDDIVIKIVAIGQGKTKIGIKTNHRVFRTELLEKPRNQEETVDK